MSSEKSQHGILFPVILAFSVASASLLLQIVQTRIYAVVFWNHVVYLIVSVALLGFGISGTWLAFGKHTWIARKLTFPVAGAAFAIFTILSGLLVPQWNTSFELILSSHLHLVRLFATYATAVLPYFFVGWILGALYRDNGGRIHLLYFADLTGAAFGCLLTLLLIRPLGAVNLVLLASAMVVVPIFMQRAIHQKLILLPLAFILIVLSTLSFYSASIDSRILPDRTKSFRTLYEKLDPKDEKVVEISEWSILARTDVVSTKYPPTTRIFIDGDAWTKLELNCPDPAPPFDPEKEPMIAASTPYLLPRRFDTALVLGSGGGPDVWNALRGGVTNVDAVEINPTTARIVIEEYSDATNKLFSRPGVRLFNAEGRSFVRSSSTQYDVIMISAIDTFAALHSGAYMLAENYLYTVEGVMDYVTRLTPEGVLCINRWNYAGETSRLFVVMLEALYQLGYPEPERHIVALFRRSWVAIMVSPKAFSDEEIQTLKNHADRNEGACYFPLPEAERLLPSQKDLNEYAVVRRLGRQNDFFDAHYYNIRPVWDDSPFFFHYEKFSNLRMLSHEKSIRDFIRGHWPSFTLVFLMVFLSIALLIFILLPLTRRGGVKIPGFSRWLVYFCLLGTSFIFVEICLMQRFSLLLGSPAMSLALVLAALLLSAGIGSYFKERFSIPLEAGLGILVVILLIISFGYPYIVQWLLGFPAWIRQVATVFLIIPAGFFMGMPFPTGIKIISATSADAVPWMWGVNGGATVLGSILAISAAIHFGFTAVLILATMGYLCALVLYATRPR